MMKFSVVLATILGLVATTNAVSSEVRSGYRTKRFGDTNHLLCPSLSVVYPLPCDNQRLSVLTTH
jgi:hypothetical protein